MTPVPLQTNVLHILDADTDATQLQLLVTLTGRLGTGYLHTSCCIDAPSARRISSTIGLTVVATPLRLGGQLNYAPAISQLVDQRGAGLIHAWDASALAAALACRSEAPRIVNVIDPAKARAIARYARTSSSPVAVVASSQVIRTRLLSAGVSPQQVVVIRGPADFKTVNAAQNSNLRSQLVTDGGPVLLMHGPASRDGGQYFGLWAAAIVRQIHRNLRVIVPYASSETNRLLRFVRSVGCESMVIVPDERLTWSQLAACADIFVAPAVDEICIEPLAVAMAARLVIVGSAVRSIAEVIADRSNGLLVKKADPKLLAARILMAIEDTELARKVTDLARSQAYEVFSVRQFADSYQRLYSNVLAGRPPGDGITDSAMVA